MNRWRIRNLFFPQVVLETRAQVYALSHSAVPLVAAEKVIGCAFFAPHACDRFFRRLQTGGDGWRWGRSEKRGTRRSCFRPLAMTSANLGRHRASLRGGGGRSCRQSRLFRAPLPVWPLAERWWSTTTAGQTRACALETRRQLCASRQTFADRGRFCLTILRLLLHRRRRRRAVFALSLQSY